VVDKRAKHPDLHRAEARAAGQDEGDAHVRAWFIVRTGALWGKCSAVMPPLRRTAAWSYAAAVRPGFSR
jgi:hypothetical protein